MSTKSREVIFGSRIAGAKIRAEGARQRARAAVREADRAEAEAWSIRMEGYGGPAQPPPRIDDRFKVHYLGKQYCSRAGNRRDGELKLGAWFFSIVAGTFGSLDCGLGLHMPRG